MKHFKHLTLTLICLLLSMLTWAQTPPSNLDGASLRSWLKANYYEGKHHTLGYTEARRKMYNYIDNKNSKISGVYSGYAKSWSYGGTSTNPDPINCEHTVPQSFFGKAEPMKSDIHHLFPTYKNWNSVRSNYAFAEIDDNQTTQWMRHTSSQSSRPSSGINEYSEYANGKFEPREDHKGNVARAVFYFFTMYPTQAGNITSVGNLNTLYQWHLDDPVDAAEIARNNAIEQYQGDRNPYIDQPHLVARAWGFTDASNGGGGTAAYCASKGNSVADEWIGQVAVASIYKSSGANGGYADFTSESTSLTQGATVNLTIKPAWSGSIYSEGYAVWVDFNQDGDFTDSGEQVFTHSATSASVVTGSFTVPASAVVGATRMRVSMKYNGIPTCCEAISYGEVEDYTVNIGAGSGSSNSGGAGGSGSPDLFISEYVEGTSYNKGVEIANLTGATVSLSGYSLRKQANGSGSWQVLNLSGSLASGTVYTLANASATFSADLKTSHTVLNFNGNDAIALFKGETLIDIVGAYGDRNYFGQEVTLERKSSAYTPSSAYNPDHWARHGQNTFSYFGHIGGASHRTTVQPIATNSEARVFPVPASTRVTIQLSQAAKIVVTNMQGQVVYQSSHKRHVFGINVSAWKKGVYVLAIQNSKTTTTQRLIVR
ncbi:endonuclease [uncultured Microscilla sp.]|uniref:endonuclease n=1 Tax=uncultured Microscilla sp. TaxID=432653 RepID=UPI00262D2C7F|nr:endonuclease [uncultured Microscilla sp.]